MGGLECLPTAGTKDSGPSLPRPHAASRTKSNQSAGLSQATLGGWRPREPTLRCLAPHSWGRELEGGSTTGLYLVSLIPLHPIISLDNFYDLCKILNKCSFSLSPHPSLFLTRSRPLKALLRGNSGAASGGCEFLGTLLQWLLGMLQSSGSLGLNSNILWSGASLTQPSCVPPVTNVGTLGAPGPVPSVR